MKIRTLISIATLLMLASCAPMEISRHEIALDQPVIDAPAESAQDQQIQEPDFVPVPDEPVEEVLAPPLRPVTLLFGGDVTLSSGYIELVPEPHTDFKWPFRRLESLMSRVDLLMVNFESSITNHDQPEDKQFVFKADPVMVNVLKENKIKIVTIANNHVYDYGSVGLLDTIRALDEAGIAHVGAGRNLKEAREPVFMELEGIKFAFLGYGNYSPAGPARSGVAYRYREHIEEDVRRAKEAGAEIVIVNFHWGAEKATKPIKSDRDLAYIAIDSGADIIIGHHPHVLQPVEIYKGKVIAFSLGNFIFGGNSYRPRESALLMVRVDQDRSIRHKLLDIIIDPQETHYQPYLVDPSAIDELAPADDEEVRESVAAGESVSGVQ